MVVYSKQYANFLRNYCGWLWPNIAEINDQPWDSGFGESQPQDPGFGKYPLGVAKPKWHRTNWNKLFNTYNYGSAELTFKVRYGSERNVKKFFRIGLVRNSELNKFRNKLECVDTVQGTDFSAEAKRSFSQSERKCIRYTGPVFSVSWGMRVKLGLCTWTIWRDKKEWNQ